MWFDLSLKTCFKSLISYTDILKPKTTTVKIKTQVSPTNIAITHNNQFKWHCSLFEISKCRWLLEPQFGWSTSPKGFQIDWCRVLRFLYAPWRYPFLLLYQEWRRKRVWLGPEDVWLSHSFCILCRPPLTYREPWPMEFAVIPSSPQTIALKHSHFAHSLVEQEKLWNRWIQQKDEFSYSSIYQP